MNGLNNIQYDLKEMGLFAYLVNLVEIWTVGETTGSRLRSQVEFVCCMKADGPIQSIFIKWTCHFSVTV